MAVYSSGIRLKTACEGDMIDVTGLVQERVSASKVKEGLCLVFVPGSTGALSTVEYEPGLKQDIPEALERIAPSGRDYRHNHTWGCDNGRSHVRATFIGPDVTVPVSGGTLHLGTWQQIVFLELDTRGRDRELVVKVLGE